MSRVRGRPPVISDARLLEFAREVFLEHGIRATTAEVAVRAGIAEGTVFRRFKSKDALFRAAMRVEAEQPPAILRMLAERIGKGDLRETLLEFARGMLERGRVALPLMMMSWSNPGGEGALEKALERHESYRCGFRVVCEFFEGEARAGRVGHLEPELMARVFMGSLYHFCMCEMLMVDDRKDERAPSAFAKGLVDLLLRAATHSRDGAASVRTRRKRRAP